MSHRITAKQEAQDFLAEYRMSGILPDSGLQKLEALFREVSSLALDDKGEDAWLKKRGVSWVAAKWVTCDPCQITFTVGDDAVDGYPCWLCGAATRRDH